MVSLIQQMNRKARCKHDGRLIVSHADASALAQEVAEYCRHPDPSALLQSLLAGHCQMFGIPVEVSGLTSSYPQST